MDRNFMAVCLNYLCVRFLGRNKYAHKIPQFGGGARTCIGKNISLLEIGTLVPNLIRTFQFELVDQNLEPECENVWFVKQKNILCKVRSLQVTSEFGKNKEVDGVLG